MSELSLIEQIREWVNDTEDLDHRPGPQIVALLAEWDARPGPQIVALLSAWDARQAVIDAAVALVGAWEKPMLETWYEAVAAKDALVAAVDDLPKEPTDG